MSVNTPQEAAQSWERSFARSVAMLDAMRAMRGQLGDPLAEYRIERRPPWWQRRARRRFDLHARIARLERDVL